MLNEKSHAFSRRTRIFNLITSLVLVISCMVGCAHVESNTTRFHSLPPNGQGETFAFLPSEEQKGSLEYSTYAMRVEAKLISYGWIPLPDSNAKPDYFVFISYSIDDGETVSGSIPIYGQTGGGTSYTSGTVTSSSGGYATYSGTTYQAPTFGQTGSVPYNRREFGRFLELSITDAKNSTPEYIIEVYEGRVKSWGSSGEISVVLPTMIESLFKGFPGVSGKTKTVNMSLVE